MPHKVLVRPPSGSGFLDLPVPRVVAGSLLALSLSKGRRLAAIEKLFLRNDGGNNRTTEVQRKPHEIRLREVVL
jgi:hypothetical protein